MTMVDDSAKPPPSADPGEPDWEAYEQRLAERRAKAAWQPTGTWLDYWTGHGKLASGVAPARGRLAEHKRGVYYQASWEDPYDGFSEHSRRCALALRAAGMPVQLHSLALKMRSRSVTAERDIDREMRELREASIHDIVCQVIQTIPGPGVLSNITMRELVRGAGTVSWEDQAAINRRRILSVVYERWPMPRVDIEAMNKVAEVWTACERDAAQLDDQGVRRVCWIPVPHFPDYPLLKLRGRRRVAGPVRFYNIGKWEPRKEQRNVLGAFMIAFRPGEAHLYLKTSPSAPRMPPDYPPSAEHAVRQWLADPRVEANGWTVAEVGHNIFLVRRMLPESQMRELHRLGDIYVTLSRAEGFDMPAYDAKLAGNRMVYTPSGGPSDFAASDDFHVKCSADVEASPFYGWEPGARYHGYDIEVAAAAMRRALDSATAGAERAIHDMSFFSAASVGARMLGRVLEVTGGRP